jgi:hypothetical protein
MAPPGSTQTLPGNPFSPPRPFDIVEMAVRHQPKSPFGSLRNHRSFSAVTHSHVFKHGIPLWEIVTTAIRVGIVDQLDPTITKRGEQQGVLLGSKHPPSVDAGHRLRLHSHTTHRMHRIPVVGQGLEVQQVVGEPLCAGGRGFGFVDSVDLPLVEWIGAEHEAYVPLAVSHERCASPHGPRRHSHSGRPAAGVTSQPASGQSAGS